MNTNTAHQATAAAKRDVTSKLAAAGIEGRAIRANAKSVTVYIADTSKLQEACDLLGGGSAPKHFPSGSASNHITVTR